MFDVRYLIHSEPGDGKAARQVAATRMSWSCARTPATPMSCCVRSPMGKAGRRAGQRRHGWPLEESLRLASSLFVRDMREEALWYAVVGAADDAVCEDDAAGYCSLVSLCVSGQAFWGASCGDSGALLLSGGRDFLLTDDQRKNPPVGSSAARPVAFSRPAYAPGWVLLVVSDGVWKYVGWERITQHGRPASGAGVDRCLASSGPRHASGGSLPDDFSVALLYDGETQMEQNGLQL